MRTKIMSVLCVVILISLFLSIAAHAESWVLWKKIEIVKMPIHVETSWEIINAYPDFNQCKEAQKRIWQVLKSQNVELKEKYGAISEIKEVPYELIIINFKKSKDPNYILSGSYTLYCLPGGLDPREKK